MKSAVTVRRIPRKASENGMLQNDVASMLREWRDAVCEGDSDMELAHDIIVVVRERVLQEMESYARENIR